MTKKHTMGYEKSRAWRCGAPLLLQRVGVFVGQLGTDASFNELRILSNVPVSLFLKSVQRCGALSFTSENALLPNKDPPVKTMHPMLTHRKTMGRNRKEKRKVMHELSRK